MSINFSNIYNDNNNLALQRKAKKSQRGTFGVTMIGNHRQATLSDKSCDGKFSFSEAAKNFAKGLVSPITGMFESKKSFLTAAAMMAGSAALVVATGGAATPFLLAAGVAMGACQCSKAAYKIAKAKSGDDVEKAFYDIGGATGTVGLSVAGAKGSLKAAGIETEGLNAFSATAKCFTSSKSLLAESFTTFKNGYFKTNISNTIKPLFQPKIFKQYSKEFAQEGKRDFDGAFSEVLNVLPEEFKPALTGRAKGEGSIHSKLIDGCVAKDKIKKVMKRADLTEAQKQAEIAKLKNKEALFKTDRNAAKEIVNDLVGTRLVLDDAGKANMDKLVASFVEGIKNDKIVISELRNYRGPGGQCYFTEEQVSAIKNAAAQKGVEVKVLQGKDQIKSSGYSAVQMKIMHKNGAFGELQIRGKKVDKVAHYEHVPYDFITGKDISNGSNKIGALLAPFKKAVMKLTKEQYAEYQKYLAKTYRNARRDELGLPARNVKLPAGYDEILSAQSLHNLHVQTSQMPAKVGLPIAFAPQAAVSYDVLKLSSEK